MQDSYDALGKITKQTDTTTYGIAKLNPFRYRGYVYDDETGLYYLQSRYYDPVTGRFINADVYCDTNTDIFGTNMFTYCNNNPVNQVDPEGTDAIWLQFPNGANGFGHTSLLLQDSAGEWWYFYWGPKHVIFRPCGSDDFSMAELNSYLAGFDARKGHNYYVKAYNTFFNSSTVDFSKSYYEYILVKNVPRKVMLSPSQIDKNMCNDGSIEATIRFNGYFASCFTYILDKMSEVAKQNGTKITGDIFYENGVKCAALHLYDNEHCYNWLSNNCAQVCVDILLNGIFADESKFYDLLFARFLVIPNLMYESLV